MIQQLFARIGIGNARVDTKLQRQSYSAGDVIQGNVHILGGNVMQTIEALYVTVYTTYIQEVNDTKIEQTAAVAKFQISENFTMEANEEKTIPFQFKLPLATPVTKGKTKVWVQTELDVPLAVDPKDRDAITVQPSALLNEVLVAMRQLGFRLRSVECEKAPLALRAPMLFVQEFEFTPTGSYRSYLDEVEILVVNQTVDGLDLLMQVDRKVRGFSSLLAEHLDLDESFIRLTIRHEEIARVASILQHTIERHL